MNIEEYSALAMVTAPKAADVEYKLLNAALGMAGEAGEVADVVKKLVFHHKALDAKKLIEEAGDCVWYINLLINTLGYTWSDLLEANIAKLKARFPEGTFDPMRANNRDEVAEQAAISKVL